MADYQLSQLAKDDLRNLWNYSFDRWGEAQADRYYAQLIENFRQLAVGKRPSRPCDIRNDLRKCAVGKHVIYFSQGKERITILRVLHQSMDVERHI